MSQLARCWVPDCRLALGHLGRHDPRADWPPDPRRVYVLLLVQFLKFERDVKRLREERDQAVSERNEWSAKVLHYNDTIRKEEERLRLAKRELDTLAANFLFTR